MNWTNKNALDLLRNPKDAPSFFCGRWNSETNPDLAFLSLGRDSSSSHDRRVLENSRSQHRPSLITACKLGVPVPSAPYKRWSFRKANCQRYSRTTNELAEDLPPPNTNKVDEAYHRFCAAINTAAEDAKPSRLKKQR